MVRMRLLDHDKTYTAGFAFRNECSERLNRFMQENGPNLQMRVCYGARQGQQAGSTPCHWRSVYTNGAFVFADRVPWNAAMRTKMVVLCDSGFAVAQDLFNRYDQRDRELECKFTFKGRGLNSPEITLYPWFGRVYDESLDATVDKFDRLGRGQIVY